jgi:hypothetical protein
MSRRSKPTSAGSVPIFFDLFYLVKPVVPLLGIDPKSHPTPSLKNAFGFHVCHARGHIKSAAYASASIGESKYKFGWLQGLRRNWKRINFGCGGPIRTE